MPLIKNIFIEFYSYCDFDDFMAQMMNLDGYFCYFDLKDDFKFRTFMWNHNL